MAKYDTRPMSAPHRASDVASDLACISCGYNLVGLRSAAVCPECGTPVERTLRPVDVGDERNRKSEPIYSTGQLADAIPAYLSKLSRASGMLALGAWGLVGSVVMHFALGQGGGDLLGGLIGATAALAWTFGVIGVTAHRRIVPRKHRANADTTKEWRWRRLLARGSVGCVISAPASLVWAVLVPQASLTAENIAIACTLVAQGGMIGLALQIAGLAYWAVNIPLAFHMRATAYFLAVSTVVGGAWMILEVDLPVIAVLGDTGANFRNLLRIGVLMLVILPWIAFAHQLTRFHRTVDATTPRSRGYEIG